MNELVMEKCHFSFSKERKKTLSRAQERIGGDYHYQSNLLKSTIYKGRIHILRRVQPAYRIKSVLILSQSKLNALQGVTLLFSPQLSKVDKRDGKFWRLSKERVRQECKNTDLLPYNLAVSSRIVQVMGTVFVRDWRCIHALTGGF